MIAWIDAQVGVAGDMLLAALVDAGAPEDGVRTGLATLGIADWTLEFSQTRRGSLRAVRAVVAVGGVPTDAGFKPAGPHVHRPWREIRGLLSGAPLPERVRTRAIGVFSRLAAAEAEIHGVAVDDVELHEVGSVDAIVDIVGCCLALELLGIDRISASALPLAAGTVTAAHGRLSLPAPATLALMRGWPSISVDRPGEWVTPTGAALVTALAEAGPPPPMIIGRVGYGAGRRDPAGLANLVRVVLGEPLPAAREQVVELACNIDDLVGQDVPPALEALLAGGALDAWFEPVTMKKGRPGLVIHALSRPDQADALADLLLRHTSTLGVRRATWDRRVLERWDEVAETRWGPVRIKVGGRGGQRWHGWPEFEDCLAIARTHGLTVPEVQQAAIAAWDQVRRRGEPYFSADDVHHSKE